MRETAAGKLGRLWWRNWRRLGAVGMAIATSLLLILTPLQRTNAQPPTPALAASLPVPQTHPLPVTLAQWQAPVDTGDYFFEVKPTPAGYLVWSQFPVKVYIEQPTTPLAETSSTRRFQGWVNAVLQAVQEWDVYLPLAVVAESGDADILIWRSRPPLQPTFNRETGELNLPRARAAETRYEFYLRPGEDTPQEILSQRFTIQLSPDQSDQYTLATARHELGHALGIWGHSPLDTDALYFAQVRNSPQISTRDINTLKRVYEQPTRLGWTLID